MAIKKTTNTKAPVKTKAEPVAETKAVEAEVQTGDVVGVTEEITAGGSDTVCVCANTPFDVKFLVPDSGGRMVPVVIKGNGSHLRGKDRGILAVGAYGITANVPREAWEYILEAYADNRAIRNGLIFATSANAARAQAKERKDLRHGLEPIDPTKAKNSRPLSE